MRWTPQISVLQSMFHCADLILKRITYESTSGISFFFKIYFPYMFLILGPKWGLQNFLSGSSCAAREPQWLTTQETPAALRQIQIHSSRLSCATQYEHLARATDKRSSYSFPGQSEASSPPHWQLLGCLEEKLIKAREPGNVFYNGNGGSTERMWAVGC